MTNYKISATSDLLRTNCCWDPLKADYALSFEDHGNVINSLLSKECSGLIIVILLEDLIYSSNGDFTSLQHSQIEFLRLIKERAQVSEKPIILCFGSIENQNVIESVKCDTDRKKFQNWLHQEFTNLRDEFESIYFVNLNEIFFKYGAEKMFSERNWYFGRCRFSINGLEVLSQNLSAVLKRTLEAPSKVLVLDCDNTIWGGVIGEDGLGGLILGQDGLGQAFVDFQKEVLRLAGNGVIIVLASKNNEEDVWNVFDNHDFMVLKREHIVAARINWKEKAHNLAGLADSLALGADSFVFWDDNPLERDKMKNLMPQVFTVDVPDNVEQWPALIRSLDSFAKFKVTSEDKEKTAQYQARARFTENLKKEIDLNYYLASLNPKPSLLPLTVSNTPRAEQMCLKTNQFNLTTKRYSSSDLSEIDNNKDRNVFLVSLTDSYGDHGIVALVCLRYFRGGIVFLDMFLMSCRILGRHLEAWVLNQVLQDALDKEKQFIIADFIDTGRNKIAEDFLRDYKFERIDTNVSVLETMRKVDLKLEGRGYCLKVKDAKIPNIEIFERQE